MSRPSTCACPGIIEERRELNNDVRGGGDAAKRIKSGHRDLRDNCNIYELELSKTDGTAGAGDKKGAVR